MKVLKSVELLLIYFLSKWFVKMLEWLFEESWDSIITPRRLALGTTFKMFSPNLMGLCSGPQNVLWDMIMASEFPACIVSLLCLPSSKIYERALFKPSTASSTLSTMTHSVLLYDTRETRTYSTTSLIQYSFFSENHKRLELFIPSN